MNAATWLPTSVAGRRAALAAAVVISAGTAGFTVAKLNATPGAAAGPAPTPVRDRPVATIKAPSAMRVVPLPEPKPSGTAGAVAVAATAAAGTEAAAPPAPAATAPPASPPAVVVEQGDFVLGDKR